MGTTDYAFIHALRAVAALWVLVVHVMIWSGWGFLPLGDAKLAVDLFMLLSGFLMAALAGPLDAGDRARFWMRRFFRIAPAYYAALLLAWLGSDAFLGGYDVLRELRPWRWTDGAYDPAHLVLDARSIAWHVTFAFGLHPQYSASTMLPDWSLALEMQFYLAFPLLCLLMRRLGVGALVLVTLLAYVLGDAFATPLGFREPAFLTMKLHVFVAGMLLHRATQGATSQRVLVSALAVFLASLDGVALVALVLVISALSIMEASDDNPLEGLRRSRIVRFASETSYGVYLFHGFWIAGFGLVLADRFETVQARGMVMLPVVLVGAYATGWVVHRYVELPGIAFGRALMERRKASGLQAVNS